MSETKYAVEKDGMMVPPKQPDNDKYRSQRTVRMITNTISFIVLLVLALLFLSPIAIVVMNSFKGKFFLRTGQIFELLTKESFVGWDNYKKGAERVGMFSAIKNSAIITVCAVIAIVLFTAMTAWYLTRVKTMVSNIIYYCFVFSMIVPFQMVMFPMASLADMLGLNTVYGLIVLYVGFGAGQCVFMFGGFIKSIPIDIEEAAMIDGCNPIQTFFRVVLPMLKPTMVTLAILETMWVWNDYLLPKLILPTGTKTIPLAIDACTGSHGVKEIGWLMAMLVIAIIPIIAFYLICQKHIIKGVAAGAVKG